MPSLSKLLPKASRIKLTPGSSTHTSRSASPSAKDRREEAQEKHVEAAEQHVKDIKHARQEKARDLEEHDDLRDRYGSYDEATEDIRQLSLCTLRDLVGMDVGETVCIRARLELHRNQGAKLAFALLRSQTVTLQAVCKTMDGEVSQAMIDFIEHVPRESLVWVQGRLQRPMEPIKSATLHDIELLVVRFYVVAEAEQLPFSLNQASSSAKEHEDKSLPVVELATRLANRTFDLRSGLNQAIFRIQAATCRLFREYLDQHDFLEIHSPKLQAGATESGASVFPVRYFSRYAALAQSPQLSKQMAISADFERVYEIGPVFRAENSNTHRHLTEFTGLDLELTIAHHYHEVLRVVDGVLRHIFAGLQERYEREIEIIRAVYPSEPFKFRSEEEGGTPILTFAEACELLKEDGIDQDPYEDIDTPTEKRLGALIKRKYDCDYWIADKFPLSARPFYTHPDAKDPRLSNSFDIYMRGQEIVSGGQRVHNVHQLRTAMRKAGVAPESLQDYVDAFALATPEHGGAGLGLERIVMLFLGLDEIRLASLFPRDPRSLPAPTQEQLAARIILENKTEHSVFTKEGDGRRGVVIVRNTAKEGRFGEPLDQNGIKNGPA